MPDTACNHNVNAWRMNNASPLIDYNTALVKGHTPDHLIVDQFDTNNDADVKEWLDRYLSFGTRPDGCDQVFAEAEQALSIPTAMNPKDPDFYAVVVAANHFTRAQYATHYSKNDYFTEALFHMPVRTNPSVLQVMTDLTFDAHANGVPLVSINEPNPEKLWIDLFANSIGIVTDEVDNNNHLPVCVLDVTAGYLVENIDVIRTHMSTFRRPLLTMIADALWMLVADHDC